MKQFFRLFFLNICSESVSSWLWRGCPIKQNSILHYFSNCIKVNVIAVGDCNCNRQLFVDLNHCWAASVVNSQYSLYHCPTLINESSFSSCIDLITTHIRFRNFETILGIWGMYVYKKKDDLTQWINFFFV